MYELDYEPERLDWNEYFTRYKETRAIKYYREFLHFYEPVLDRKTRRFIDKYEIEDSRAEDLKQIVSILLWEELQSYDSELPLLQLIKYKVQAAWQEYVRVNCGNFQVDNRHQYLLLKKIAYLYFQKKDNNSLSEIISEVAADLNLTEESVEKYLVAVSTFKPKYNADFYANDDEDSFYSSAVDSVANDLDTEALYFKLLRQEKLNSALADLRKPDRLLIEYVYGICPKCLKNKEKKTLREASLLLGLTEDGAEKKLKNILNKLKKNMVNEGCGHCTYAAFFVPTNRDKSPVWALLGEVGLLPDFLFRAKFGEFRRVRVSRCS